QSVGDPTEAARLALAARRLAAPYDDQRDLECSALRVLGDSLWPDVAAARRAWQEGADLATAHGMRLWRGRLLICLARADLLDGSGEDVIAEVEEIAREAGAPLLAAQAAALQAELALLRWRPDEVREHLRAVEALLSEVTLPAAVAADVATVSDVAEVLAGKHAAETPIGRTVLDLLDGVVPEPRPTGMSVTGLLVRSVVDPGFAMSWSGRAEGADTDPPSSPGNAPDVLSLGRTLSALPWLGALRVMWTVPLLPAAERRGEQVDLLRRAAEVFDALPAGAGAARRCRDHLRERGASFPRRPSAQHGVPTSLSRQGITIREWDVLRLLEEGLTSRQIADRLFLSPRTVEKHVERMLAKTGAPNRAALAAISAAAVT
ncbi:MAG TPA: LuxR C-terminal-related transcriptional regulator, partial [Propionibacteriaceae bacterium]|nr:LuxR C-terminal-related transcriptional regulator [Propionibacteriaceae bacterium]